MHGHKKKKSEWDRKRIRTGMGNTWNVDDDSPMPIRKGNADSVLKMRILWKMISRKIFRKRTMKKRND